MKTKGVVDLKTLAERLASSQYDEGRLKSLRDSLTDEIVKVPITTEGVDNMRKARNGLRPVTIKVCGSVIRGYLLHIGLVGNVTEGIDQAALVEHEDGSISQWSISGPCNIHFDDVEHLSGQDLNIVQKTHE